MNIGYARVSTLEQTIDLQVDALKKEACEKIISDTVSGSKTDRKGLLSLKDTLRTGDTLIVWRLDRLARSLKEILQWVEWLKHNGIGFKSIQESIDTRTSSGILTFHIFGALAEFERNLIRERTKAGLEAARARGRQGGRPCKLTRPQQTLVSTLYHAKQHSLKQICAMMSISKPTLYHYIKHHDHEP